MEDFEAFEVRGPRVSRFEGEERTERRAEGRGLDGTSIAVALGEVRRWLDRTSRWSWFCVHCLSTSRAVVITNSNSTETGVQKYP